MHITCRSDRKSSVQPPSAWPGRRIVLRLLLAVIAIGLSYSRRRSHARIPLNEITFWFVNNVI
jgi:hypothetical protein